MCVCVGVPAASPPPPHHHTHTHTHTHRSTRILSSRSKGQDAETRDQTGDLQIFGLTLSQLSYRGLLLIVADSFATHATSGPPLVAISIWHIEGACARK